MFRGVQSIEGRVVQVRIQTLHMLRRQLSQAERGELILPTRDFISSCHSVGNPNMQLDTFGVPVGFPNHETCACNPGTLQNHPQ